MSLVDRLQSVIVTWMSARKGRTLRQLSEETQLNYGTIKNIADAKCEPNGETVLRLLLPILAIDEVHTIVANYFPHMAPYAKSLCELKTVVSNIPDLTPKHNRAIFELSFGSLEEETVALILGAGAKGIIDDLVEAEICLRSRGTVMLANPNMHFPKQQYANDIVTHLLAQVNIMVPGNKLAVQTKSLNDEGIQKAYDILLKAEHEMQSLLADPAYQGHHKFGAVLLTTIL